MVYMNPMKKTLIGIGVTLAIATPTYVNINVSMPISINTTASDKQKQWEAVTKSCTLEKSFVTTEGLKVCDYVCGGADKQHIYKTYFSNTASCPQTIEEKVKVVK